MTVASVEKLVKEFLSRKEPAVLAVHGDWGVGKTFSWNRWLTEASKDNQVHKEFYSYVSLFGLTSIEAFNATLFENTRKIGETVTTDPYEWVKDRFKKAIRPAKSVKVLDRFTPSDQYLYQRVNRDLLICIDDFERRSASLPLRDVLGMIYQLRDQRNCHVCLIFSAEAFSGEDKKEYARFREKAIDLEIKFAPTSQECIDIAIDGSAPHADIFKKRCFDLQVNNIRVIRKADALIKLIAPKLDRYHPAVLQESIHAVTLFAYLFYTKSDALPSIEYALDAGARLFMSPTAENNPSWNSFLQSYEYLRTEALDRVLAETVQRGYVDEGALLVAAQTRHHNLTQSDLEDSFRNAWRRYLGSFEDNETDIVNGLDQAFKESILSRTRLDLDTVVRLFRNLGRDELANELIEVFVAAQGDKAVFDLNERFSGDEIKDDMIVERFSREYSQFYEGPSIEDVVGKLSERVGWNPEDVQLLSTASPDELYNFIKAMSGPGIGDAIRGLLVFGNVSNPTPEMQQVDTKVREVLRRIASENRLNRQRIQRFGVTTG
jgi:hypothetical protein